MSTVEDFEKAPVGAIATHDDGSKAMKMGDIERRWVTSNGVHLDDEEVEHRGYTRDPLWPAPATAREALGLAWELAYPVKDGQVIPDGTQYLEFCISGLRGNTAMCDFVTIPGRAPIRTLDPLPVPLPVPLPDWLDAPAVLAHVDDHNLQQPAVFTPTGAPGRWSTAGTEWTYHWSELRDVTPLYPNGQEA